MEKLQETPVRGKNRVGRVARQSRREKVCKVCGCTDREACRPFGCSWVARQPSALCSVCLFFLINVRSEAKRAELCRMFGLPLITDASIPAIMVDAQAVNAFASLAAVAS